MCSIYIEDACFTFMLVCGLNIISASCTQKSLIMSNKSYLDLKISAQIHQSAHDATLFTMKNYLVPLFYNWILSATYYSELSFISIHTIVNYRSLLLVAYSKSYLSFLIPWCYSFITCRHRSRALDLPWTQSRHCRQAPWGHPMRGHVHTWAWWAAAEPLVCLCKKNNKIMVL